MIACLKIGYTSKYGLTKYSLDIPNGFPSSLDFWISIKIWIKNPLVNPPDIAIFWWKSWGLTNGFRVAPGPPTTSGGSSTWDKGRGMTKAGLRMGYNWYGFSWDICEIYKDLYLGYIYILGIWLQCNKNLGHNSWSIFGGLQKMVIFCWLWWCSTAKNSRILVLNYLSKVGDESKPAPKQCLIRKWVITPIISGLTRSLSHVNHWGYNPLTSRGMSHQVGFCQSHPTIFAAKDDYEKANPTWMWRKTYRCEDRFMTPNIRPTKSLEMLVLGCWCPRKEDLMRTWWVVVYVSRRKWENHRWGFECY